MMTPNSHLNPGFFMGEKQQRLNDIMNTVSSHLDRVLAESPSAPRPSTLSELDAFAFLDPLLSSLRKDYLDARGNRLTAAKDFGTDDGLSGMAAILEDSAWCAMQTRYMELRANRTMMAAAQKMIEDSLAEDDARAAKEKESAQKNVASMIETYARMRAAKPVDPSSDFWLVFFLLFYRAPDVMFRIRPVHQFNRLAA